MEIPIFNFTLTLSTETPRAVVYIKPEEEWIAFIEPYPTPINNPNIIKG